VIVTSDNYTTFVSYNQADRARAEWIAWEHEAHDHKAIIQAWDFTGSFILEMHKAAASSDKMIAVLSKNYLDAEYNHPEWAAAFVKDPTSGHDILGLYRAKNREPVRREQKVGRNDPCPCSSCKKYKRCHGRAAAWDTPRHAAGHNATASVTEP
jgi:hypothetical protein